MPSVVEKNTSTRSCDYEWSAMCLKTPMDIDTDEKDLEVLMRFNGPVTQGHYAPICKYIPYYL